MLKCKRSYIVFFTYATSLASASASASQSPFGLSLCHLASASLFPGLVNIPDSSYSEIHHGWGSYNRLIRAYCMRG